MNHRHRLRSIIMFITILMLAILSCQGVTRIPNPFAADTPTSTNTPTPTPTFTVTPSPTPTHTATATPRPTGVIIEEQTDGTLLVIDYDNKYQVLLPPNWAIVFSTQKELKQAIQHASEGDPDFAQMAESFKDVDPDIFRLAALNVDRNYVGAGFPIVLTVNAYTDSIGSSMPMAFVTAMIEDKLLKGATSTSWDVIDNANNVEVGIVRGTRVLNLPNGFRKNVQELVISFQSNQKLIVVEIAAPTEFAEQTLSPFEKLVDFITVKIP